jgi:hypothetical protein
MDIAWVDRLRNKSLPETTSDAEHRKILSLRAWRRRLTFGFYDMSTSKRSIGQEPVTVAIHRLGFAWT